MTRHDDASSVFRLPDLGEGLTSAEIVEWLVTEGDTVDVDQDVVVVETAKAAVEVPCPFAGTVAARHGEPGDSLAVGDALITIEPAAVGTPQQGSTTDGAEQYRTEERAGARVPAPTAVGARLGTDGSAEEAGEGSGAVLIGYGTGRGGSRRRRRPEAGTRERATRSGVNGHGPEGSSRGSDGDRPPEQRQAVRVISPLVRRMALESGLDLATIRGTGPGGVIRRADVEAVLTARAEPTVPPPAAAAPPMEQRIPLTGVRGAIAAKLATSRREIPDATTWVDADATAVVELRDTLRRVRPEDGIGLLALLARVIVTGLRRYPELNASVDTAAGEIVQHGSVHLSVATQSPRGLVVPVVHDADRMSTAELAAALREVTTAAKEGSLPPSRMTGGTFTLNNYGVYGVDGSTPILNHPEAGMLGVGRIAQKPWAHQGQLALRQVTQLSLTFDHRVCDGGTAGGFLRFVADCVEQPAVLLAEL
ncbi:dihydrolipoamide acetyltransferase family protein [Ornithinicoccus halotolerans]|uniref:dihydrolipoamide acetyltransferase family protein n=1 Tax=Ornithinicoccus halotolerans TaxID=1748220 RepID=UPI001294D3C0|nr:dihydrolipoamide acetyltransferase family protein [Ornithinicoccus halotolerans]